MPFILCDYSEEDGAKSQRIRSGRLADIAPTMLNLLGLEVPMEMDGESLLVDENVFERKNPQLQDGKRMVRPPREGNVDAGSVA